MYPSLTTDDSVSSFLLNSSRARGSSGVDEEDVDKRGVGKGGAGAGTGAKGSGVEDASSGVLVGRVSSLAVCCIEVDEGSGVEDASSGVLVGRVVGRVSSLAVCCIEDASGRVGGVDGAAGSGEAVKRNDERNLHKLERLFFFADGDEGCDAALYGTIT